MPLLHVRYALRLLGKTPAFTAVAGVTLALGIGATSAIFSAADALFLRPLPYSHPDRLLLVSAADAGQRSQLEPFSYPRFTFIQENNRTFSGIAAFTNEVFNLTGRGEPEQVESARVSWNFFDVLGIRPVLGRVFVPDDDLPGGKDVVLLSHALWLRRFGGSRDIIGQTITLDSRAFTVAGVLPGGFAFALLGSNVDLWAPRVFELNLAIPSQIQAGAGFLTAVARLRPAVSRRQAQAEMDVLTRQYQRENPNRPDSNPRLVMDASGLQEQFAANFRSALLLLVAAAGFLLLIACANVANLLLSRALVRRKEMAIRTALGAPRGAVIRQLLTESVLLALAGGAAGVLLGHWGIHSMSALSRNGGLQAAGIRMDLRVLAFAAAVSLASGVLFGLIPALQLSRPDVQAVLRETGRGSIGGRRGTGTRSLLVISQVSLSVVLLVGSGLLIRSFVRLRASDPGFDPRNVLTMRIALPPAKYPKPPQMISFYEEVLRATRNLPGVQSVAISSALPVNPSRFSPVLLEGQPPAPLAQRPIVNIQTISPGYATVMRVPLIRGRSFSERDDAQAAHVAIVNEALARRFWPNEDPIGKRIWLGRQTASTEVVGVFGDTKNLSLAAQPQPEILLPFPQLPWASLNLSLRTAVAPRGVISAVRRSLAAVDKDQPVTGVQTLEDVLESAGAQPRFTMYLLGIFSATALALAIVGIYGVIAYSVTQRTQELGIRLAFGAARADVLRLVIGQGLRLTSGGIAIGLAASLALTRFMSSLLYLTPVRDWLTFALSAALFLLVGALASYVPARRATRIDPSEALHYE